VSEYSVGAGGALSPLGTPTVAAGANPLGIAVSPNGQFAYVVNNNGTGSGGVSQYTVGTGGALTPMTTPTVAANAAPYGIAVSPSGQSVYVTNGGTDGPDGVSQYSVGAGGALAPQATATVAAGDGPAGIVVTPDQGPVASFTVSATPAGSASSFNASGSSSADSTVAGYQWSFGDGSTTTTTSGSASVTHTYAQPGTYTAQLTVVDADGCSTLTVFTGQTASCNANAAATTIQTVVVPPVPPVVVPPVVVPPVVVPKAAVSNVSVSPRTFSAAGRNVHGTCAQPSTKNKRDKPCQRSIKLTAKYTLNAAATVSFKLALQTSGRKVSGKCVKASRKNKHDHTCQLLASVHKTITRSGVAGSNKFTFTGKLVAGTYELTVTPAGGTAHTVTFKVSG